MGEKGFLRVVGSAKLLRWAVQDEGIVALSGVLVGGVGFCVPATPTVFLPTTMSRCWPCFAAAFPTRR